MEWVVLVIAIGFIISRLKSIKIEFCGQPDKRLLPKNEGNRQLKD